MNVIKAEAEDIKNILRSYLEQKLNCPIFVFPSNVASDSWSEWAARFPKESGVLAVQQECFTAWDRFKGEFLDTKIKDKTAVPSILRKLFIRNLIHINNVKEKIFFKIIPSDSTDSTISYSFTDWLSKILPSLKLWHEKYLQNLSKNPEQKDEEDSDYLYLYNTYKQFLDENNFFEPSWERPSFSSSDRQIVIFYPELLEDYAEYGEIFENAPNVTIVSLDENHKKPICDYHFSDSRKELRHLILNIRDLHYKNNVAWTDIAVHVPKIEIYAPYIKREFKKYNVPYNLRAGETLTKCSAGSIFNQINECFSDNFSYNSVRALLQNEYIPWQDEVRVVKENLIREGNRLRCLCSYKDNDVNIDSWEASLKNTIGNEKEILFYEDLKKDINAICNVSSFKGIKTAWMIFKKHYLNVQNFTQDSNRILSRCIAELDTLIEIEENYISKLNFSVGPYYNFFLSEINSKIYKRQESIDGVAIFPYKLAAVAAYRQNFVLDASQRNLNIQYKKLSFLNAQKREQLLDKTDIDVSEAFIRLYAGKKTSNIIEQNYVFSSAEDTFQGFAIAHTALQVQKDILEKEDFILSELNGILKNQSVPSDFSEDMKESFMNWKERMKGFGDEASSNTDFLQERISNKIINDRYSEKNRSVYNLPSESENLIKLSQSDMKNFYPCPRKWILSNILGIKEYSLDTNLMQNYDMGTIHHKMLELFMDDYVKSKKPLPITQSNGLFEEDVEKSIKEKLYTYALSALKYSGHDIKESVLVQTTLEAQKEKLVSSISDFLHNFCKAPSKPLEDELNSKTRIQGFGGFYVQGAELKLSARANDEIYYFGSIDCLLYEKTSDVNKYAIIDYKNSNSSLPKENDTVPDDNGILQDFQIPVYASMLKANIKEKDKIEAAYFYAIKDSSCTLVIDDYRGKAKKAEGPEKPKSYEQFEQKTLPILQLYIKDFAERIKERNYTPVTKDKSYITVKPYKDCIKCDFNSICRTTFIVGSRNF